MPWRIDDRLKPLVAALEQEAGELTASPPVVERLEVVGATPPVSG